MIGSDTLRADRLGATSYKRNLTPNIDMLAKNGVQFTNFFVPIARTAPSLASYLSWPHTHGIREYNTEDKIPLPVSTLPEILASNGWHTEAISDGQKQLGKLKFGFDRYDSPEDK